MPKKKEPELDPKEQFKRFQEIAKEHDVEPATAEKAFSNLANKPKEVAPKREKRSS